MKMTQADYEQHKARVDDGTADDDDRRLVEMYEREGFTPGDEPGKVAHDEVTSVQQVEPDEKPKKATRGRARASSDQE